MAVEYPTHRAGEEETVHQGATEYGFETVHKYPQTEPTVADVFFALNNVLYPTGRAWQQFDGHLLGALHAGLNVSFIRLIEDAYATINSTFPDTELFDLSDIELWEYRLGITPSTATPLEPLALPTLLTATPEPSELDTRRNRILQKLAYPNNVKPRQSRVFIEYQLRQAGFNVTVLENTLPYRTPEDVLGDLPPPVMHDDDVQHGDNLQHGGANFEVIANKSEPGEDYSVGGEDNLYATFFIVKLTEPGLLALDETDIPVDREKEFRELVLKLKPAQTVAYVLRQ